MLDFIKKEKFDFIIPVRDDTTIFCARYKNEISKYSKLLVADLDKILIGRDKSRTFKEAFNYNIPMPMTTIVFNEEELLDYKGDYPIILKPAISSGSRGLFHVNNHKELYKIADKLFIEYDKYLIQEFIPSNNTVAVNVLFDNLGKIVSAFSYRRVREYPRNKGPSVLRESTFEPELINIAVNFLKHIGWVGVAMVEFRVNLRDKVPKLMEINPRYWGSLALPIFAGIDFPYLSYQIACGNVLDDAKSYKVGVRARWLFMGDFLWIFSSKNFLSDLREFLVFLNKDTTYDVFSLRDIGPTIGALLEGIIYLLDKKKRKHAFGRGKSIK